MSRKFQAVMASACVIACFASTCAVAQNQASGAPPGNVSPKDSNGGRNAGYSGGAGAAGQSGTDPKTLSRTEEERVRKKNADTSHGASAAVSGKRKDWKD